ncbi:MAG TPA: hypothetical protein VFX21_05280 [Acidimicrobiia bacterium]|nr:hypothetical protein [Acidimicrobiia bacterium]
MSDPLVIAVDWSGANAAAAQRRAIWTTTIRDGRVVESVGGRTRADVVDALVQRDEPMIVGLDFSFSVPHWFACAHACHDVDAVWKLAQVRGDDWLRPTPPFWRERCAVPLGQRFRRCETRLRGEGFQPKSLFQLVGNGQVGAGSVRGMPLLATLRGAGFAVWPFDAAAERTVMEMYPSLLRARAPHLDTGSHPNEHARDATVAALVMWEHRDALARLDATKDPVVALEGDVWDPAATRPRSRA